jgi:hypothetical protein
MGSNSRLGFALAAALAAAPAIAGEPGATVALRFAWPDKTEGKRVEKRQGRVQGEVARRSALRLQRRGGETWMGVRRPPGRPRAPDRRR